MRNWVINAEQGMSVLDLPQWEKQGVKAFFSTRRGGYSQTPYQTMNLALHVGDDPDTVLQNRLRLMTARGGRLQELVCCQQVHGAKVAAVGKSDAGRGAMDLASAIPGCDALITNMPGVFLGAFFADCFAIYFFDPRRRVIGLAHAGWKGTITGIAGLTVKEMQHRFSCRPQDLEVFIGPGISSCCFEIQPDLAGQVEKAFTNAADLLQERAGRYTWDLAVSNASVLAGAGVEADRIEICGLCTACREDLFYSYRRDGGTTGRMGAFVSLQY